MNTLAAFLLAIIGPLVGRILVATGFTLVTLIGADPAIDLLLEIFFTNLSSTSYPILQLAGLAGVWDAAGILLGAMDWCVAWHLLTGASRYLVKPPTQSPE